jgi:hypothetical protein
VYWEIKRRLLDQPIVYSGKCLLTDLASRSIRQDAGDRPGWGRLFTCGGLVIRLFGC